MTVQAFLKDSNLTDRKNQLSGFCIRSENSSWKYRRKTTCILLSLLFLVLFCSAAIVTASSEVIPISVNYSGALDLQTITVDFCDDWLLQPDDQYNHKLAQASFVMAVTAFRSKIYDIPNQDHDILDFFEQAGFAEPTSYDYNKEPNINTIAAVIAHKKVGDQTIIALSISGNNYKNEWLSNFTIENNVRPAGFDRAAKKVMQRIESYIRTHHLSGDMRLWVTGYSRSAAVSNLFAADAVESSMFQAVYAYTFATPRTTREKNPERYHNIFNIINPEDIVPMIPFPEWGYDRYGIDLFLPAISTDSSYNRKYIDAMEIGVFTGVDEPIFNPRIRRELHTVFDYIAFFIGSSENYEQNIQSLLIDFYKNKDFKMLIREVREKISLSALLNTFRERQEKFLFYLNEFYNFIDFNVQIVFSSYIANLHEMDDDYWDRNITLLENVAFGHLEKTYRSWLFSSDDPSKIFTEDPKYFHCIILGDVDVEIYDERGDLIEEFDRNGEFEFDTGITRWPDFHGDLSDVLIYAERFDNRTMIELPADQKYTVYLYSHKDQDVLVSNVEFSAEKLMADVKYIYMDHYAKGEEYWAVIDPARERLTADEIPEDFADVRLIEPWDEDIDYSPTTIMRLENKGAFLPKTLPGMIFLNLVFFQIMGLLIIAVVYMIRTSTIFVRRKLLRQEIYVRADPLELPEAKKRALEKS